MQQAYNIKRFLIQNITFKKKIRRRKKIKQNINKILEYDIPEYPNTDNLQLIKYSLSQDEQHQYRKHQPHS